MTTEEADGIQAIIRQLAERYLVNASQITGGCRRVASIAARGHAIALAKSVYPDVDLGALARMFGMFDHTSVMRAIKRGNPLIGAAGYKRCRSTGFTGRKNHPRLAGVTLRPAEVTKITREEDLNTQLLALHNEKHLNDLDEGGYPDASSTELLVDPDQKVSRFIPISRQVLWSSRAQVAA